MKKFILLTLLIFFSLFLLPKQTLALEVSGGNDGSYIYKCDIPPIAGEVAMTVYTKNQDDCRALQQPTTATEWNHAAIKIPWSSIPPPATPPAPKQQGQAQGKGAQCFIIPQDACDKGIEGVINFFANWVTGIIGTLVLLIIIVSGVQFITSTGNPDAVASAKGRLFNAVIGLILLIAMRAIIALIGVTGVFK